MARIRETIINIFDGGIVLDERDPRENTCIMVTGFDILTTPKKMTPYRESEGGHATVTTSKPQNLAIALRTGTTYSLYSLGVISGDTKAEVYYKNLTINSSNDLTDAGWITSQTNKQGGDTTAFELFIYYPKKALIYGVSTSANKIWAFDPTDGSAWADDIITDDGGSPPTMTNVAQGLVHSKDDILYIPYDNIIMKNNDGTWDTTALTLPTHYRINSITEFGNYLAIGCQDKSGIKQSAVFLWDMDSATWNESYNWGEGNLKVLEEIDGQLVGISSIGDSAIRHSDRVSIKVLSGSRVIQIHEFISTTSTTQLLLPIAKQKINNRLYFMMQIGISGTTREGVWSVGRSSVNEGWSIIHERTPNNNTALSGAGNNLYNFIFVGDFLFQSYQSATAYALSKTKTVADATYTANAIYESKKLGDPQKNKKLISVGVMTEATPSAGQIVLKYMKDAETSYDTTIYTNTDDSDIYREETADSSGNNLPLFREISFQIISTGNVAITGLKVRWEELDEEPSS